MRKKLFAVCCLLPYRQCFFVCQRINILKLIFQGGVCWLHSVQRQYQPVLCRQTHFWIPRFQRSDNVIIHTKIDATFTFQRRKNVIILTTISSLSFFFKSGFIFYLFTVTCQPVSLSLLKESSKKRDIWRKGKRHIKKKRDICRKTSDICSEKETYIKKETYVEKRETYVEKRETCAEKRETYVEKKETYVGKIDICRKKSDIWR